MQICRNHQSRSLKVPKKSTFESCGFQNLLTRNASKTKPKEKWHFGFPGLCGCMVGKSSALVSMTIPTFQYGRSRPLQCGCQESDEGNVKPKKPFVSTSRQVVCFHFGFRGSLPVSHPQRAPGRAPGPWAHLAHLAHLTGDRSHVPLVRWRTFCAIGTANCNFCLCLSLEPK